MNRLEGKRIFITGASRGLGRALALRFAEEGAAALALVARDRETLERVRQEIPSGPRVTTIAADLSQTGQLDRSRPAGGRA